MRGKKKQSKTSNPQEESQETGRDSEDKPEVETNSDRRRQMVGNMERNESRLRLFYQQVTGLVEMNRTRSGSIFENLLARFEHSESQYERALRLQEQLDRSADIVPQMTSCGLTDSDDLPVKTMRKLIDQTLETHRQLIKSRKGDIIDFVRTTIERFGILRTIETEIQRLCKESQGRLERIRGSNPDMQLIFSEQRRARSRGESNLRRVLGLFTHCRIIVMRSRGRNPNAAEDARGARCRSQSLKRRRIRTVGAGRKKLCLGDCQRTSRQEVGGKIVDTNQPEQRDGIRTEVNEEAPKSPQKRKRELSPSGDEEMKRRQFDLDHTDVREQKAEDNGEPREQGEP